MSGFSPQEAERLPPQSKINTFKNNLPNDNINAETIETNISPICSVCGKTTRPTGWLGKIFISPEIQFGGLTIHEGCKGIYLTQQWKSECDNLPNLKDSLSVIAISNNCFGLNNAGNVSAVGTIIFLNCGILYLMNINHSSSRNMVDMATMSVSRSSGVAAGIATGLVGGAVSIIAQSIRMNSAMIEPIYSYNLELLLQDIKIDNKNIYRPYSAISSIKLKTGGGTRHGGSITLVTKYGTHSDIIFLLDKNSVNHLQNLIRLDVNVGPLLTIG